MAKYQLYDYQKKAVNALLGGKKIIFAPCGAGKLPVSVVWAAMRCQQTGKDKVLVISTPSKALHTQDFQDGFDGFVSPSFRTSLSSLSLTSWHQLYKWVGEHKRDLSEWVVIADEVARMKGGVSSRMGKSFLRLAQSNPDWAGFTGTPGDKYIDFYAYFQACGLVRNKTEFMRRFCVVQTFKGFPEIARYLETDTLKQWWKDISYAPDTAEMEAQLPTETYKTVMFKKPAGYDKVIKLRQKMLANGEFKADPEYSEIIQNASALTHYLRQLCFTKQKQEWIKDFLTDLDEPIVIFYNYTSTATAIEEAVHKANKDAKVWRIDGSHHEIPTAETIGKRDVVLAQWQSGGEALNLQFLRYWLASELCYSYSQFVQAKGRIRRIGQERPMFYYRLITENTIDERVAKCLSDKQDFSEEVWLGEEGMV